MARPKSFKRDTTKKTSRKRDAFTPLGHILRTAREQKGVTQKALANSLGLRQRQISDLERAAMDPRFSTVQDVARALELEVTLVPRHLVSTLEGLQRREQDSSAPMYALEEDKDGAGGDADDADKADKGARDRKGLG